MPFPLVWQPSFVSLRKDDLHLFEVLYCVYHLEPVHHASPAPDNDVLLVQLLSTGVSVAAILFAAFEHVFQRQVGDEVGSTALGDESNEVFGCIMLISKVSYLVLWRAEADAIDPVLPCWPCF